MAVYFNCCLCASPVPHNFKRHRVYEKNWHRADVNMLWHRVLAQGLGTGAWHRSLAQAFAFIMTMHEAYWSM